MQLNEIVLHNVEIKPTECLYCKGELKGDHKNLKCGPSIHNDCLEEYINKYEQDPDRDLGCPNFNCNEPDDKAFMYELYHKLTGKTLNPLALRRDSLVPADERSNTLTNILDTITGSFSNISVFSAWQAAFGIATMYAYYSVAPYFTEESIVGVAILAYLVSVLSPFVPPLISDAISKKIKKSREEQNKLTCKC